MPAAPLDGGRVLRAILWRIKQDRLWAAIAAARAGKIFGMLLVGLGLLDFATAAGFGGLWLVLLGWFLVKAAGAEERDAHTRRSLGGVLVRDVMTPDPITASAGLAVPQFIDDYLFRYRCSSFPLRDERGDLTGLVTLAAVKRLPAEQRATATLAQIACPIERVPLANPDDLLVDVLPRMTGCADGRALVMADGALVGIVSPTDITAILEATALRDAHDSRWPDPAAWWQPRSRSDTTRPPLLPR